MNAVIYAISIVALMLLIFVRLHSSVELMCWVHKGFNCHE